MPACAGVTSGRADSHAGEDRQAHVDGDPDHHRRRHRHLPAHPRAARRSGGLFRRPRRNAAIDRRHPQATRPRPAAARAVRALCRRPRAWRLRQFALDRSAGGDGDQEPPAGLRRTDAARPDPLHGHRRAARHPGGGAARARGSTMPAASSPPPACRCRCSSPACCWSMCSTSCSAGRRRRSAGSTPSPPRRRGYTGFLPDRQPAGRRFGDLPRRA